MDCICPGTVFDYLGTGEPSISHAQCPGPDDADTFPANIRRCGDVNLFGRFMIAVVVSFGSSTIYCFAVPGLSVRHFDETTTS